MKGYKAFNADWTCRGKQYKVGETFTEEGKISVCEKGMHFCPDLADVFHFYHFNPEETVIAEVEAMGNVVTGEYGKACTDKLRVVREVPWAEAVACVNGRNDLEDLRDFGDGDIPVPGEMFKYKGYAFVSLGLAQGGLMAMTADVLFLSRFGRNNDWRESDIRKTLNGWFLDQIGTGDLLEHTTDLTSDDGLTDYGTSRDFVSLLTDDIYRKNRKFIPKMHSWWWTCTPYSTYPSLASRVRNVKADGSLSYNDAYYARGAVAGLVFNLKSYQRSDSVAPAMRGDE